jgi:hypothetical protein
MQSNVRVRQLCERKATPYSAHSGRQQAIDRGWGSHPAPFLIYGANAIGANILGSELDRNKMNGIVPADVELEGAALLALSR